MLVRHSPAVNNFYRLEKGANLLKSAGVDLSLFAKNLRKLDRTRMMIRSLERVVKKQRSMALRMILEVKIRKIRAMEGANGRVKARLLMAYNQLFKKNKTPQRFFYNWYLRSNPEILKKLAWHLLMKQKMSTSVALYRLTYLLKFKLVKNKKLNDLHLLEGLCWFKNFIEKKNFLNQKKAFDRMNPMNHNGKYFLLERVWKQYNKNRIYNLKKALNKISLGGRTSKKILNLLFSKNNNKLRDAFRNLRGFNKQENSASKQIGFIRSKAFF